MLGLKWDLGLRWDLQAAGDVSDGWECLSNSASESQKSHPAEGLVLLAVVSTSKDRVSKSTLILWSHVQESILL